MMIGSTLVLITLETPGQRWVSRERIGFGLGLAGIDGFGWVWQGWEGVTTWSNLGLGGPEGTIGLEADFHHLQWPTGFRHCIMRDIGDLSGHFDPESRQ